MVFLFTKTGVLRRWGSDAYKEKKREKLRMTLTALI